jgi:hypothetical protein
MLDQTDLAIRDPQPFRCRVSMVAQRPSHRRAIAAYTPAKQNLEREDDMQRGMTMIWSAIGALTLSAALVMPSSSHAQTGGMERRGDRRDDRQGARDEKRECKAGDEKTRPECRQDKREGKQEDRTDGGDDDAAATPGEPEKSESTG